MHHRSPKHLLVLVASLSLVACSGLGIKTDLGYAQFELAGDVALAPTVGGISLDAIKTDVQDDLGLDEAMSTPYGRVEVGAGVASFTFSGFQIDQADAGFLRVQFGDIPLNTPVTTDLEMRNLKGAVHFDLLNLGVVRLSPGIGVDLFDIDLTVASPSLILEERVDALAPVPMVFIQGEVDVGIFEAVIDVGGIVANIEDADGTFLDIEVLARLRPFDHVELFAGVRHILFDVEGTAEGQDFLGDLTLTGWMVGGGISF